VRVVSGKAKGRTLKAVPGMGTRPTTDKVKEAIFSMIGPYFDGGQALDLFAGSGGLGIEAISRGMDRCVFVDMDKKAVETVYANLEATHLKEQAEVYRNDAQRALKALGKRETRFGLVFLDPPYRLKAIEELIGKLSDLALLEDGATVVAEHDVSERPAEAIAGCVASRRAEYGDTAVTIYTYEKSHEE